MKIGSGKLIMIDLYRSDYAVSDYAKFSPN